MNNVNCGLLSNLFIIITANNYSRSTYKAVYTCISDQTELLPSWRLAVEQTATPNKQVIRISITCAWNWNSPKMARQARTNDSSNNFKFYFTPTPNKKNRTYQINSKTNAVLRGSTYIASPSSPRTAHCSCSWWHCIGSTRWSHIGISLLLSLPVRLMVLKLAEGCSRSYRSCPHYPVLYKWPYLNH